MPPADGSSTTVASRYLSMWLDLTTTHRQTWLFSCTSKYHSTDLLTARGVAHLVVHRTSGSTSYETIPPVRLETSGGVLSTVDMVVQRHNGPRWLRDNDDDDDIAYSSTDNGHSQERNRYASSGRQVQSRLSLVHSNPAFMTKTTII